MALDVQVDGERVPLIGDDPGAPAPVGYVESCSVRMGLGGADEFRILIEGHLSEAGVSNSQAIAKAGNWIGKPASLCFTGSSGKAEFAGTVTDVELLADNDGRDCVVLVGHGPLWFLAGGEQFRTFAKKAFAAVVKEVLSASGISPTDESESKHQFDYLVQHGETDLAFLNRICRQEGEWLFYDGASVCLGVAFDHGGAPLQLEWGKQLVFCRAETHCVPLLHQTRAWNYEKATPFDKTSKPPRAVGPDWATSAVQASLDLFADPAFAIGGVYAAAKDVDDAVRLRSECCAAGTAAVRARTTRTGVVLGASVELAGIGELSGSYRVIELEHGFDVQSGYSCSFLAAPRSVRRPGSHAVPPAAAVLQVGTVEDNADPDKLGRVRVKLRWHTETTPWLRVLQIHAGADHGLYAIPEKGDEVLVGFECGDPDRPMVLGSLYHGQAKPQPRAVSSTNDHKQILTRSGNIVRISDTKGQEEISVSTPDESNKIVLHAGSKPTITVETKGSMTLKAAEKIKIEAGEQVLITAPKVEVEAAEKASVTAPSIEHDAQQEHKITSAASAKVSAATVEVAASATMKLSASATADLSAGASMALKAPMIRLN